MPAASALRAEKAIAERSRGAHPCVAQLASSSSRYGTAPAILAESCRMKACASEPRAPRTLTAKVRSRRRGAPTGLAGRDGILARRQGPLEVAMRRTPRGVRTPPHRTP